jgi:hypothetical protein
MIPMTLPIDSWLNEAAGLLTQPIATLGALKGLGLEPEADKLARAQNAHVAGHTGLGASWYPDAPWFSFGDESKGIISDIKKIVRNAMLDASESMADGLIYQFSVLQEQGELHRRYTSIYGVVKDSTDPNIRCGSPDREAHCT